MMLKQQQQQIRISNFYNLWYLTGASGGVSEWNPFPKEDLVIETVYFVSDAALVCQMSFSEFSQNSKVFSSSLCLATVQEANNKANKWQTKDKPNSYHLEKNNSMLGRE